jgi:serine/threonine-protein kinase HipA
MKKLKVKLLNEEVGLLNEDEFGRLSFEYLDSWLNNPNSYPISLTLGLEKKIYDNSSCRGFFAGLLPDDQIKSKIASKLKISEDNDFSLLEILGGDCAGAISIESDLKQNKKKQDSKLIEEKQLQEIFALLNDEPLLTSKGIRLSLAGAQNKIALVKKKNQFYIPADEEITTHILKPSIKRFSNIVFNEFACMKLGSICGLNIPNIEVGFAENTPYLIIERYDRQRLKNGRLQRIHQEDFCQALGIIPEKKYQKEGGPSIKSCADLIDQYFSRPGLSKLKLLDIFVFNFLIGNNDAHGKNFALILGTKSIELAPSYDLLSTEIYPQLNKELAMKFGKQFLASKINKTDLRQLAEDFSIKEQLLKDKILAMQLLIQKKFPELYKIKELSKEAEILDGIYQVFTKRSKYVERLFT